MFIKPERAHRLSPLAQAEYEAIFNDPKQKGSLNWHIAGRALIAAGVLPRDTPIAREDQPEQIASRPGRRIGP